MYSGKIQECIRRETSKRYGQGFQQAYAYEEFIWTAH